ncbi:SDR family NAD(P)-dependent oxidoreductase [Streptomyces minutiscleroticus]|uniref:3-oxoacyl-ACP reductase n=1 Tax=Streptomyces minutiscleroticus TaxID=68238 RepID=A0A918NUQ9_9ACTN|nr:SDR family NAD(P)-dependent oxidoreductase [Streptomyces minutiscleroticus]GGX96138.1 3-oxoacyl-ACP reductase [Streptomyces minutiscleroticus]
METPTVLVTGAARGLGQELAVALGRHGYRVAGLDAVPQPETAGRVLDYLELVADVADEEQVRAALERVLDHFGTLHALVNDAGGPPEGEGEAETEAEAEFERTTPQEWRRTVRDVLEAPFVMTRAVLPHLKAAGWGRIVNVTPAAVSDAPPARVAHTAAQTGLVGLTRALAGALAPYAITVNAIAPGPEPEDLIPTLLYVLDEGNGRLTGQTLDLSGGPARR